MFTLLPVERISETLQEHFKSPEKRLAQRTLAEEVVTLLHRKEVAQKCIFQTAALYPAPNINNTGTKRPGYRSELILQAFRGDKAMLKRLPMASIDGVPLSRLLKTIGLATSNSFSPLFWTSNIYRRWPESYTKRWSLRQWRPEERGEVRRGPGPLLRRQGYGNPTWPVKL